MPDSEAPLTPGERLALVYLYAHLAASQNQPSSGLLDSESACYADLNISSPETLSRKAIPEYRVEEGIETSC